MDNFLAASTPGGIEAQEKRGQLEQAALETLPIKGTADCRSTWEKLGFVFGENADDLFVSVKFPSGWKKRPTDHSMWSDLLDGKDRIRARIFYKAAFYDRSANVQLVPRFSCSAAPIEGWEAKIRSGKFHGVVYDADKTIIFQTSPTDPEPEYSDETRLKWQSWKDNKDQKREEAIAWLTEKYPLWEDVSAYWD